MYQLFLHAPRIALILIIGISLLPILTRTDDSLCLLWRRGWDDKGGVLDTLLYELSRLATDVEHSPREHDAVLLLVRVLGC
jgi:hypothetical protein